MKNEKKNTIELEPLCCNSGTADCVAKKNLRCTILNDTKFKKK